MVSGEEFSEMDARLEKWLEDLPRDGKKQLLLLYGVGLRDMEEVLAAHKAKKEKRMLPVEGIEGERFDIKSIVSPVWNREKVVVQLDFVKELRENIEKPLIFTPGKETRIPQLKEEWVLDHSLRAKVHKFEKSLEKALHSYNKQLAVNALKSAFTKLPFDVELWRAGIARPQVSQDDRKRALEVHDFLENQYYLEGNVRMNHVAKMWDELNEHSLGKLFLLKHDEMGKLLEERMKRRK
jgi:hypothetical protein